MGAENSEGDLIMEQQHIVLVGAGMMGASLSQVYAQDGYQVSLWNG